MSIGHIGLILATTLAASWSTAAGVGAPDYPDGLLGIPLNISGGGGVDQWDGRDYEARDNGATDVGTTTLDFDTYYVRAAVYVGDLPLIGGVEVYGKFGAAEADITVDSASLGGEAAEFELETRMEDFYAYGARWQKTFESNWGIGVAAERMDFDADVDSMSYRNAAGTTVPHNIEGSVDINETQYAAYVSYTILEMVKPYIGVRYSESDYLADDVRGTVGSAQVTMPDVKGDAEDNLGAFAGVDVALLGDHIAVNAEIAGGDFTELSGNVRIAF